MSKLTSQEIGSLFEKAAQQILILMFRAWGYDTDILESNIQKSGSQFGFDIYFKLRDSSSLPLSVFVECKGSNTFNEISKQELTQKSDQLNRSFHSVKDIHIFLSPTRTVKYANDEEKNLENNNYPFCIVDMMRNSDDDILNLFTTYNGNNCDIIEYKEKILNPIIKGDNTKDDFQIIASRLKKRFDARIKEYLSLSRDNDFVFLTASYWNNIHQETDYNRLSEYYIRTDAGKQRLMEVVANDYYVVNEKMTNRFLEKFSEIKSKKNALIKILSNGGEGKSTFLLHIGKKLCDNHPVFYIEKWFKDTIQQIIKYLSLVKSKECPVLLLDNAAIFEPELEEFGAEIRNFKSGIIMIIAERHYRYNNMQVKDDFEFNFSIDAVTELQYSSRNDYKTIFEKFYIELKKAYPELDDKVKMQEGNQLFTKAGRYTIAERIYETIRFYHHNYKINFKFDWDEWENVNINPPLKDIYLLVAAFYQFGNRINLSICNSFSDFKWIRSLDIRNAIDETPNQPIIRYGDVLQLRHEKIAEWCIIEKKQKDNVKGFYQEWFENIDSPYAKDLFLWTYRNHDFRNCSYLSDILPFEKVISILNKYIDNHKEEIKARTELGKVYQHLKKWNEAEKVLNEILALDTENVHTRTELGKVYQHLEQWDEAEKVLKKAIELEPKGIHQRTELGKVYQHLKKWNEAEKVLNEILALDKENVHTRTELGKVYQHLKKWDEAEKVLKKAIELEPKVVHQRTELGKVYQHLEQWDEAEKVLKKAIELEPKGIHQRTELGKVYQHLKKWNEAEKVLKKVINIDEKNVHVRTQLGELYLNENNSGKAVIIFKEVIELDKCNIHACNKLGSLYLEQQRWEEAEEYFSMAINRDTNKKHTIHTRIDLGTVYRELKKLNESENTLEEVIQLISKSKGASKRAKVELAITFAQNNKSNKAILLLDKLIEDYPKQLHARTQLAKIHISKRRYEESIELLKEVINLEHDNFYALNMLADIYTTQKRRPQKEDVLFKILKIKPDNTPTLIELGKVFIRFRKYHIANELFEKAHIASPVNLYVICELLELCKRMKNLIRFNELKELGNKIIKSEPNTQAQARFGYITFEQDGIMSLVQIKVNGIYNKTSQTISSLKEKGIKINENAEINYRISDGDNVIFAMYYHNQNKNHIANFIEPYYENIDNLEMLK
jgi:tetratricopeptide (TPR) repeat protein